MPFKFDKARVQYVWKLFDEKKSFLSTLKNEIKGEVEDGARITGPVHIGRNTVVHSGAIIRGPVWIGEGASIRWHAVVRDGSILGNDVVVGANCEVKESILMTGAKMQGTYCGNSIMGEQARVSSGTVFENRKFNRKEVIIGPIPEIGLDHKISTGLNFLGCILGDQSRLGGITACFPGTLIGQHTWVYGHQHLRGFIPSNTLVKKFVDPRLEETNQSVRKDKIALDSGFDDYEWR